MRRRGISRVLRLIEVCALVLAAGLLGFVPAGAQEAPPTLAFYALSAKAAPVFQTYNQPQFPIPATPTQELSIGHSEVSLENGTAHGVASYFWPGSTAANFPSALRDLGVPPEVPALPNYPVRAESFYPASEGQEDSQVLDAGVVAMRSSASATECTASARSTEVEGVLQTGIASSRTTTVVDGAKAISRASSSVSDIQLAGGVVAIEKVTSFAEATSDGVKAELTGRTVVTGLTIQGVEMLVDRDGVHLAGNDAPLPLGDVTDPLNEQLAQAGIAVFVAEPLDLVEGAQASRSLGGLIITFQPKTLADNLPPGLLSSLPPEVPGFLTSFDQTVTIALGGIAVRVGASPPFVAPPPPPPPPPPSDGGVLPPPATEAPPAPVPSETPAPSPAAGTEPPAGETLPVAMAASGLIIAAVTTRGLRRVADGALSASAAAPACILGEES